ncbi:hypothetical protein TomTYG75_08910 [Sphingobium sp. TomTYG75]
MSDYLDELDDLLINQFDEGMLLSELDGFLTGIIVSPDMVPPSAWMKQVWGPDTPKFDAPEELQRFFDLVMRHHNETLIGLDEPAGFAPILEVDTRSNETLWELWIEGFSKAMKLAPRGWNRIRAQAMMKGQRQRSPGSPNLQPSQMADMSCPRKDRWDREAPDLIPIWVQMLHEWRLENDQNPPMTAKGGKVGRNDPCPCGSGKKYKKCCGLN